LDQATWLPEEGKKVLDDWVKPISRAGRNQKTVDENYKKVEDFFAAASKTGK